LQLEDIHYGRVMNDGSWFVDEEVILIFI